MKHNLVIFNIKMPKAIFIIILSGLFLASSTINVYAQIHQETPASQTKILESNPEKQIKLFNKCILSVEKRIYSLLEIYALIEIWNILLPNRKITATSNWLDFAPPVFDKNKSFLENYQNLPDDVQKILFITFTWSEVSRLSIYASSEIDKDSARQKVMAEASFSNLPQDLQKSIKSLSQSFFLEHIDMILRAKSVFNARGGLKEQAGRINWFWCEKRL